MAGLINFEDENEVKQFLDNLGVEYSYQCYKEKDPEGKWSCAVPVSVVLKHWTPAARDQKSDFTLSFLGCQRLADYLEGVKKNYESTAQVLKHNCETNGHGESCYKLGAYHVTGKGKTHFLLYTLLFGVTQIAKSGKYDKVIAAQNYRNVQRLRLKLTVPLQDQVSQAN